MEFDREIFAEMLKKALGERTLKEYSAACGISDAHISNLINKKTKSPPEPPSLQKLASAALGGVTYEDLMLAAGYLNTPDLFPTGLPEGYSDMSFLEGDVMEWVKNPQNAEYIKFAYRVSKKGITEEVLKSAKIIIAISK